MKKYIYIVDGVELEDTECWGKAWKEAKLIAERNHAPIFRRIITEEEAVFCNGGIFLTTLYAKPDQYYIY